MEWIKNLQNSKLKTVYSQYGEDAALKTIFENIGTTNKFLVDFGAGDGNWVSNSKLFLESGWDGLLMDGNNKNSQIVKKEFITAENICQLFEKYNVPSEFDLLSIDIDGNDFWVLKKIMDNKYEPRVVILEFNGTIKNGISKTIKYNPNHIYGDNDYYGASFEAFKKLMTGYGYTLIMQIASTNMIFVDSSIIPYVDYGVNYIHGQYHKHFPNGEWVEI